MAVAVRSRRLPVGFLASASGDSRETSPGDWAGRRQAGFGPHYIENEVHQGKTGGNVPFDHLETRKIEVITDAIWLFQL